MPREKRRDKKKDKERSSFKEREWTRQIELFTILLACPSTPIALDQKIRPKLYQIHSDIISIKEEWISEERKNEGHLIVFLNKMINMLKSYILRKDRVLHFFIGIISWIYISLNEYIKVEKNSTLLREVQKNKAFLHFKRDRIKKLKEIDKELEEGSITIFEAMYSRYFVKYFD